MRHFRFMNALYFRFTKYGIRKAEMFYLHSSSLWLRLKIVAGKS